MLLKGLLFFQLLYVVNQLHLPLETHIPGMAMINLIFVLVLLAMRGKEEVLQGQKGRLEKPLLIFFGMLTFAFLIAQITESKDLVNDFVTLKTDIFFPLLYFQYFKCRQDEKTTRWLIIWILVIAAVAGLEAVREGIDYGFGKYNPMSRASGPFGSNWRASNVAGVFFAIFMPMFIAIALFLRKSVFWRFAGIGGIVLLAGGTLFTYSRQSYFIVLFAATALLVRKSLVFAVIMGITLVSLAGYLPDSVTQRVEETKQTSKRGEESADVSTASRWEIWGGAMGMVAEHPIGVGLARFPSHIGNYCSHKNMDAHNFYVLTLAETGPQGLIAWFFVVLSLFRLAKYLRQNAPPDDPEAKALTIGFTVSTVCMCLGGMYGSPLLREGAVMGPYWALAGLLERYIMLKNMKKGPTAVVVVEATLADRFPLAQHH